MARRPGLKWGDTRVAYVIVARRVEEALRAGRSVKSVYDELKGVFPGSYSQFARYARRSSVRTRVRTTTARDEFRQVAAEMKLDANAQTRLLELATRALADS